MTRNLTRFWFNKTQDSRERGRIYDWMGEFLTCPELVAIRVSTKGREDGRKPIVPVCAAADGMIQQVRLDPLMVAGFDDSVGRTVLLTMVARGSLTARIGNQGGLNSNEQIFEVELEAGDLFLSTFAPEWRPSDASLPTLGLLITQVATFEPSAVP